MFDLKMADRIIRDCKEIIGQEPELDRFLKLSNTAWPVIKTIFSILAAGIILLFLLGLS